jgi:hypothetical protein
MNNSTVNALFENSTVHGINSNCFLMGTTNNAGTFRFTYDITNVEIRNITGTCDFAGAMTFINGTNPGRHWSNIEIKDSTFDNSADNGSHGSTILITATTSRAVCTTSDPLTNCCSFDGTVGAGLNICPAFIDSLSFNNIRIISPNNRAMTVTGPGVMGITVTGLNSDPTHSTAARTYGIQVNPINKNGVFTLSGGTVGAGPRGGLWFQPGNPSGNSVVQNVTFNQLPAGGTCILVGATKGASITGVTCIPANCVSGTSTVPCGQNAGINTTGLILKNATTAVCPTNAGYFAGDEITIQGGASGATQAVATILQVDPSGCPLPFSAFIVSNPGNYTTPPGANSTTTALTGSGTNLKVNPVMDPNNPTQVIDAGVASCGGITPYAVGDIVEINGGVGTPAQLRIATANGSGCPVTTTPYTFDSGVANAFFNINNSNASSGSYPVGGLPVNPAATSAGSASGASNLTVNLTSTGGTGTTIIGGPTYSAGSSPGLVNPPSNTLNQLPILDTSGGTNGQPGARAVCALAASNTIVDNIGYIGTGYISGSTLTLLPGGVGSVGGPNSVAGYPLGSPLIQTPVNTIAPGTTVVSALPTPGTYTITPSPQTVGSAGSPVNIIAGVPACSG